MFGKYDLIISFTSCFLPCCFHALHQVSNDKKISQKKTRWICQWGLQEDKDRSTHQPTAVQTENNKNVKSKLDLNHKEVMGRHFVVIRQILERELRIS